MLTLITALLTGPIVADTTRVVPSAPPVQITLNDGGNFAPGGQVNVRVQTNDDGYLIVFRVDGDGRIRVLFPLDPDADAFVRGGKEYELRGRGERSTFLADDRGGSGMIYAALAPRSLNVRDFSSNGHWDYDALRLRDSSTDAENDLTALVTQMTGRARFDYDAIGYRVQDISTVADVAATGGGYYPGLYDPYYNPRWRCLSCGWGYPGYDVNIGFGYSPFWDPWLYSPWGYNYGYGFGYGFTGNNWWYGGNRYFPVGHAIPPGTRGRPRPEPRPQTITSGSTRGGDPGRNRPAAPPPPPPHVSSPPASSGSGTRSRPRPNDMAVTATRQEPAQGVYTRPVFRQPQPDQGGRPRTEQPQSRPVYREPPQVYRAPPQQSAPRSAPAPAASHSPPPPPAAGHSGGESRARGRP